MSKVLRTAAKVALGWSFVASVVLLPAVLIYRPENWRRAMLVIATYTLLLFFIIAFLLYRCIAARDKGEKHLFTFAGKKGKKPKDK
jgi:hypothetical protein